MVSGDDITFISNYVILSTKNPKLVMCSISLEYGSSPILKYAIVIVR